MTIRGAYLGVKSLFDNPNYTEQTRRYIIAQKWSGYWGVLVVFPHKD